MVKSKATHGMTGVKDLTVRTTFKKGFYETEYGNVAFVSSFRSKTAYDIDMGETIPIELVDLSRFIREGHSKGD